MKKKIADVDLSSGVPMVVALDKNMYKSPGQVRSIFIVHFYGYSIKAKALKYYC